MIVEGSGMRNSQKVPFGLIINIFLKVVFALDYSLMHQMRLSEVLYTITSRPNRGPEQPIELFFDVNLGKKTKTKS